jgi:hypothetical protein
MSSSTLAEATCNKERGTSNVNILKGWHKHGDSARAFSVAAVFSAG